MLTANPYRKTKNQRGYMHPLSSLTQRFVEFCATVHLPVMDMGCAYGNAVIAALEKGANTVIACDMAEEHLAVLQKNVAEMAYASRLITKQGVFPRDIYFEKGSLAAIHTSHMLPYLTGAEVEQGLAHFFHWLAPGGKLFIACYSRFIRELMNDVFQQEYARRLEQKMRWPGYLENFDAYSYLADEPADFASEASAFPTALHVYDIPVLQAALITQGFDIEWADYLDGKINDAVPETWYDGREYLGIIAVKPNV